MPISSGRALEEHAVYCELLLVMNGEQAIELVEAMEAGQMRCPDLIILDLNLPKKTGREVLERMRASAQCGPKPIVVLTSSDSQKDKDDAAQLGASAYLKKPSRLTEFLKLGGVFKEMLAGRPAQ